MFRNQRKIEEDLESDDELPSDYNEVPDIPAYKNDHRFDTIQFPWLQKYLNKEKEETKAPWKSYLYSTVNEQTVSEKTEQLKCGEKLFITQGVLTKGDILCLKSIESTSSDAILLWLINFLKYKDLQSNFGFLKTCLVGDIFGNNMNITSDSYSKMHNFEIITSK